MQIQFFKRAAIVMATVLFSTALFAQTYSNKPSSIFSFTAGMTSTKLLQDGHGYRAGILFDGGVSYSVSLGDHFNIAADLLYTGKAFKSDDPVIKYRNYFVDIPLYLQWKLSDNVRINAGGQYSIGINSQVVVLSSNSTSGVDVQHVAPIKSSDYGFLLGGEFDITKSFGIGARYTISGSTFFERKAVDFGVFMFCLKYSPIKTYKVFFPKKDQ